MPSYLNIRKFGRLHSSSFLKFLNCLIPILLFLSNQITCQFWKRKGKCCYIGWLPKKVKRGLHDVTRGWYCCLKLNWNLNKILLKECERVWNFLWRVSPKMKIRNGFLFLAVHNSSICDLVTHWLTHSLTQWDTFCFWH